MPKQGPPLGAAVVFTHYYDKPTRQEVEAHADEGRSTITLARLENTEPTKPAVVVGISRAAYEAPIEENHAGYYYADWQASTTKRSTFYVLKRSLIGRRFLVKLEDMDGLP